MKRTQFAMLILLGISAAGGCTTIATTQPSAQQNVNYQNIVQTGTALDTQGALMSLSPTDAATTAQAIYTVANTLNTAASQPDFDSTSASLLANTILAKTNMTPQQRIIASQVVNAVTLLVQTQLDAQGSQITTSQRAVLVRQYTQAACQGAMNATALWVTPTPPSSQPAT